MIALVGWVLFWVIGAYEGAYAFFWITGRWLPWYGDALLAFLQPVTFFVWLILWLAHFTALPFPVLR